MECSEESPLSAKAENVEYLIRNTDTSSMGDRLTDGGTPQREAEDLFFC